MMSYVPLAVITGIFYCSESGAVSCNMCVEYHFTNSYQAQVFQQSQTIESVMKIIHINFASRPSDWFKNTRLTLSSNKKIIVTCLYTFSHTLNRLQCPLGLDIVITLH